MKKFCFNCLKYPMIFLLIVSSAITIYTNHKGYQFDPIREIQRLKSQNRRDDALDLAKFYRENQTEDQKKFAKIEKSLEYTPSEKIKSFAWNGAIMGEVYDSYSGMGAISADLCIVGDLRDLGIQGWKYLSGGQDFDRFLTILSAAGIGLSSTPFLNGTNALAKNTIKYLKEVPTMLNRGLLKKFLSGKVSPENCKKILGAAKKNQWSIPRTVSCLSNIQSVKHLDTATDLITHHKRTGNVFINLTGDGGLSLYSSIPKRLRNKFIGAFKRNPKALIGITKSHLIIHTIKVLDKYKLVAIVMPFVALALLLSMLPNNIVWCLLIGLFWYLAFQIIGVFENRSRSKKKGR